jgi:hypothetical protein
MRGGEHRRGRAALGDAEDDRPLDPGGVEHRERVVDDVLERVGAGVAVREPHPALVERDDAAERPEPLEEALRERQLDPDLQVAHEAADEQQVHGLLATHAVGDRDVAVAGVANRAPGQHRAKL